MQQLTKGAEKHQIANFKKEILYGWNYTEDPKRTKIHFL